LPKLQKIQDPRQGPVIDIIALAQNVMTKTGDPMVMNTRATFDRCCALSDGDGVFGKQPRLVIKSGGNYSTIETQGNQRSGLVDVDRFRPRGLKNPTQSTRPALIEIALGHR
jgi:hypothetical protein